MRRGAFWKKWGVSYLFAAFYILLFLLFTVVPVVVAIALSFTSYNMLQPPVWVGWANYVKLLSLRRCIPHRGEEHPAFRSHHGPLKLYALSALGLVHQRTQARHGHFSHPALLRPVHIGECVHDLGPSSSAGDMYGWVNSVLIRWGIIYEPCAGSPTRTPSCG